MSTRRDAFLYFLWVLGEIILLKSLKSFHEDESGQAITEYVLLLSMTLAGAILMARGLITAINASTLIFGGQLEKDLKTGRADLGLWSN